MTSCLFPLWMGQIMYNMFRLGFCLIKKKKKKKKKQILTWFVPIDDLVYRAVLHVRTGDLTNNAVFL